MDQFVITSKMKNIVHHLSQETHCIFCGWSIKRLLSVLILAVCISHLTGVEAQVSANEIQSIENSAGNSPDQFSLQKAREWSRAKWQAAMQRWSEDAVRFNACSSDLRQKMESGTLTWPDQRRSMFSCMNGGKSRSLATSETVARVKAWATARWNAEKDLWRNEHERFFECEKNLKELLQQKKLSRWEEREFLVHCVGSDS